jgi:hypothetical protein
MRTPVTLLALLAGLVALFGVAINLGESIVGGFAPAPNRQSGPRSGGESDHGTGPGGLAVASQGYVQRLFPIMAPDGTWSVSLRLDRPGTYRAFAEFLPGSATAPVILGVDLDVPGLVEPGPIPKISSIAEVDDYSVIGTGDLIAGSVSQLWMHVIRDDLPVTDLDTYLGNAGRLVILREGDLAYLHVRPIAGPRQDTTIGFEIEAPSAGYYRMFMEFQHHGQVRTAEFTVLAR